MRRRGDDDPLTFGDVIEADWLYDLYLREGSEALLAETDHAGQEILRYKRERRERERAGGKDYAVGFATAEGVFPPMPEGTVAEGPVAAFGNRRKAIVLTDECETEKVIERGGRLLVAVLAPWPTNPPEIEALSKGESSWRRFALPPGEGADAWPGAVVDFSKHVAVWHEAIPNATRVWTVDPDNEANYLKVAWATYATRHGPIAVTDGFLKLIEMYLGSRDPKVLQANHSRIALPTPHAAARDAIWDLSERIWDLEGRTVDEIARIFEKGGDLDGIAGKVLEHLAGLGQDVEAAEAALRAVIEAGTPRAAQPKAKPTP